jgi:hypothetical protein
MVKKTISILFIVTLLVFCVLGYLNIKKQGDFEQSNVFNFVGNDAIAYVRANNPQQICNSNDENSAFFNLIYGNDKFITQLIPHFIPGAADTNFVVRRNSVSILSSVFANNDKSIDFVHFIPLKKDANVNNILKNIAKETTDTLNTEKDILCYEIDDSRFYLSNFGSFVAISSNFFALKNNLQQVKNKQTLADDLLFTDVSQAAGRYVDANVFINSQQLPNFVSALLGENISDDSFGFIKNLARWFILDASITNNLCHINGFAYVNDNSFLNLLNSQKKAGFKTLKVLSPETTVAYSMQIGNTDSLINKYKNFLADSTKDYSIKLTQISDSLYIDAESFITSLYPEEIALAYSASQGWITLIKVLNAENAENELKKLDKPSSLSNIVATIFGEIFNLNKGNEINIVDDFIVISKNKINELSKVGILSVNSDYIVDESLATFYANPRGLSRFFDVENRKNIKSLRNIFIEIIPSDKKFYVNSTISLEPSAKQKKSQKPSNVDIVEPEIPAKATLTFTDVVVLKQTVESETNKQKYTATQYNNNTVKITDAAGKLLWTKNLDEKIEGDVSAINPFNKGIIYFLFNTENKIYLFDINGKSMSGFPIALPASATNSVSACTYDTKSDYRIFIACANKRIYLYNTNGERVSGWRIPKTEGIVQRPMQFFRMNARDYLVTADNDKVYVFNRKGYDRTEIKEKIQIPVNAKFEELLDPARLRTTDKSGKQITINLRNGKVERK